VHYRLRADMSQSVTDGKSENPSNELLESYEKLSSPLKQFAWQAFSMQLYARIMKEDQTVLRHEVQGLPPLDAKDFGELKNLLFQNPTALEIFRPQFEREYEILLKGFIESLKIKRTPSPELKITGDSVLPPVSLKAPDLKEINRIKDFRNQKDQKYDPRQTFQYEEREKLVELLDSTVITDVQFHIEKAYNEYCTIKKTSEKTRNEVLRSMKKLLDNKLREYIISKAEVILKSNHPAALYLGGTFVQTKGTQYILPSNWKDQYQILKTKEKRSHTKV